MSNESKTTSAFPASSDHLKTESERGHLPTMPDPSENNPEGGPHLPTMPDPGNDPARGQQLPSEPEPSQKPPHIRDPLPPGDGDSDNNEKPDLVA